MASSERTSEVDAPDAFGFFVGGWVLATFASLIMITILGGNSVGGDEADGSTELGIGVLAASLLAGWTVYLAAMVVASKRSGSGDVRADYGIGARPVDIIGLPIGVVAQLALIPLVYAPLRAIWPDVFSDQALTQTAEDLVRRADGSLLIVLILAVGLGAPIVEELFYRGLLQRPMFARFPTPAVVIGVAVVFALIHFRPVEYPGLFAAGLVFGLCAWRTDRLAMSMCAHMGFNAVGLWVAIGATSVDGSLGGG